MNLEDSIPELETFALAGKDRNRFRFSNSWILFLLLIFIVCFGSKTRRLKRARIEDIVSRLS